MPGVPTANEILTSRHVRHYLQFGGGRPTNKPLYYGSDAQYMIVDTITVPQVGTVAPLYVPDPRQIGFYKLLARTIAAPTALPKATLTLREKHGAIPRQLQRVPLLSIYENDGVCVDPSNFLNGWSDGVIIYSFGITETKNLGNRGSWMTDVVLEDKLPLTLEAVYAIGPLAAGEAVVTTNEIISVTYGSFLSDGSCGPQDDGTKTLYAAEIHGVGAPTSHYSLDGGATWTTLAITGFGAAVDPSRSRIMGNYWLILSPTEDAYYVIALDPTTHKPIGTTWTKVTAGFAAGKGPTDMVVVSPTEAYLCGLGGYLYKCIDPTAGVTVLNAGVVTTEDFARIALQDQTIIAGATTHVVVVSANRGLTWAKTATDPGTGDINGVSIVQPDLWWACDSAGKLWYTQDDGQTWTQQTQVSGLTTAMDVQFVTKEVGFVAGANATPLGFVWGTWDGGHSWTLASPRFLNALTVQGVLELAFPNVADQDPSVASSNLAAACLGDSTIVGAVVIAASPRI